jgi:hypothetical protein
MLLEIKTLMKRYRLLKITLTRLSKLGHGCWQFTKRPDVGLKFLACSISGIRAEKAQVDLLDFQQRLNSNNPDFAALAFA